MNDRDRTYLIKELTRTIDESDSTAAFCLCQRWILKNALALLKEDCHNCKLECLLQKYDKLKEKYDVLLKEQEAAEGHRIVLEHCAKDTKDVVDEVIENLCHFSDDEQGVCCCAIKCQEHTKKNDKSNANQRKKQCVGCALNGHIYS